MRRLPAVLTLLLSVAFAAAPLVTRPFTGYRPDQLPIPQTDPPVQPEGYAFAIWGLIYAWLVVSGLWGLWRRAEDPAWDRARLPLIGALALGVPWLSIANTNAPWSTAVILGMMACAIAALLRTPDRDRWWLRAPVALLAGWLTAAGFASLGIVAAGHGLLFGPVGWAVAAILLALAVAAVTQWRMPGAPEYGLAVVWALVAIAVANGTAELAVTLLAAAGALVVAALAARGAVAARA